jgi:hypothetical protein
VSTPKVDRKCQLFVKGSSYNGTITISGGFLRFESDSVSFFFFFFFSFPSFFVFLHSLRVVGWIDPDFLIGKDSVVVPLHLQADYRRRTQARSAPVDLQVLFFPLSWRRGADDCRCD